MGLRSRVALFVAAVVVLPLLVGAALLQQVAARGDRATPTDVEQVAAASRDRLDALAARAADEAELLASANAAGQVTGDDAADAREFLIEQIESDPFDRYDPPPPGADAVLLVTRDRTTLAQYELRDAVGITQPTADEIAERVTGPPPSGALLAARPLWPGGRFVGWAVAVVWLDDVVAGSLPVTNAVHAAILDGQAVVGATAPLPRGLELSDVRGTDGARIMDRWIVAVSKLADGRRLLVWAPTPSVLGLLGVWLALVAWATCAVALVHTAVERAVVAPVRRTTAVAAQIAAGELDRSAVPEGAPELRAMAVAVNGLGGELDRRLRDLDASREQLRGALSRLGETLSSSLDLERTLALVTDTAMDTVQADRATLVLTTEGDDLEVKIDRGFGFAAETAFDDHSLPGWVVRTGLSVRLPADNVVISSAVEGGMLATHQLSVPVTGTATGGRIGALVLARPEDGPSFSEDDLRTVRTFASQAGVAIENVLLHQEARRLSLTDPLTELWNFRYFQLQAIREVEAATRYHRPLGLLIVDLDHFKHVNDRHGHPVGDQVLAEVGRRIRTSTRLPDIVARYGGEEFVLLLPGTDDAGAVVTAERIRRRVSRLPIVAGGKDALRISVTCSVGVAAYPAHGGSVDELLRRADAALYAAKSQGRDRVVNAGDLAPDARAPVDSRLAAR